MQIIEKPRQKRKFSQSCQTKEDFIGLLWELREKAENKKYDPELFGEGQTEAEQNAFANGEWHTYDWLLHELAKSPDRRTY